MPRKDPSQQILSWRRLLVFTIVMPVVAWVFGYWSSRIRGCESGLAVLKASAYALSWLSGWLVYACVLRPFRPWEMFVGIGFTNITILEPKAAPWPFQAMLQFGVLSSMGFGLIAGLMMRAWRHFIKRAEAENGTKPPPDPFSELA